MERTVLQTPITSMKEKKRVRRLLPTHPSFRYTLVRKKKKETTIPVKNSRHTSFHRTDGRYTGRRGKEKIGDKGMIILVA